ncbi:hypothetical protein D3C71_1712170 [compost metagenome]
MMFRASSSNLVTGPASASLRGQFQPVLATHHHAVTQHLRSRPSARLAAGWLRPRRRPAAVTLRARTSASNNFNRLRSIADESTWCGGHCENPPKFRLSVRAHTASHCNTARKGRPA